MNKETITLPFESSIYKLFNSKTKGFTSKEKWSPQQLNGFSPVDEYFTTLIMEKFKISASFRRIYVSPDLCIIYLTCSRKFCNFCFGFHLMAKSETIILKYRKILCKHFVNGKNLNDKKLYQRSLLLERDGII